MSIAEPPITPAFTCLYRLECNGHCILQIQQAGLPNHAAIPVKLSWFSIDKQTLDILPLTFRYADSSGEIQECFFDQGYLKFNNQSGTYIEKFNAAQYQLENKTTQDLPKEMIKAINLYLG